MTAEPAQGQRAVPDEPPMRTVMARDPADLRRLLIFGAVTAFGLVAAIGAQRTTAGAESDLIRLLDHIPVALVAAAVLAVQVLHLLLFLGLPLGLAIGRRWGLLGRYLLTYALTAVVVSLAERRLAERVPSEPLPDSGIADLAGSGWPPATSLASAVAVLVLLAPRLNRGWRRFGWVFVVLLALVRVITSQDVVVDLIFDIGAGGAIGHLVLLAAGRPLSVPGAGAVAAGLARIGLPGATVGPAPHRASGSMPFGARLADGRAVHCKVLTARQYQADSLLRTYRRVRVRELGEELAYSSVRRAAAVEAMLAMTARGAGARTPGVLGVAALSPDAMVLAFDEVSGTPLDRVDADRITDDVLRQAWQSLACCNTAGIAHRDLQLSSWMLDDDDRLWLIDFSFGEPAAGDGALRADIAELLAATYAVVGAERAVAAARDILGPQRLESGLSHLVPAALTKPTRSALKGVDGGLEPLVQQAAAACGVDEPKFATIERFKPRTLLMMAMLAVAVYVLLPQFADLPRMIDAIREADPALVAGAAAASLATYLGVALALTGSIPAAIRFVHSLLTAVAASFVGAVAPPGVAHVGINVRLAQKHGVPGPAAVSAAAAKEVAVAVVHVVLLLLVAIFAGSSDALRQELEKLPDIRTIAIVVAVVLALAAVSAALPQVRRMVAGSVLPAVRHSVASLRELAASPVRIMALFGGALLLQVGYILALDFSVRALGGDVPLVTVALIYLTVGAAASIAPTPGGIGAVEAVLLAALTGVGMAAATALAAVFLYRLVTFWVPIPIGAVAMRYLTAREVL